jgi:preprotein translocase subunit YajC
LEHRFVFNAALTVLAQSAPAAGAAPTSQPAPFWANPLFALMIGFAVLMIFSSRTKKNEQKKVQSMLDQLKKGDRIQTIGGILGTVVEARENEVLVKVDETNNTKLRFSRKAIHRVIEDDAAANASEKK